MTTPLRIGILGAARIADDGIVEPAKVLGHELIDACYRGAGLSPRGPTDEFAAGDSLSICAARTRLRPCRKPEDPRSDH
jgi:hypothetical protein